MKLSTAYNHKRRLVNKLTNAYACAVYDRPSHSELMQRINAEVWQDPGLKRSPGWVRSALMERRQVLSEQIYNHLVWAFIGSDGVPRCLNSLSEADRQKVFNGEIQGRHYWLKTSRQTQRLQDGTILETISKTPTLSFF